MKSLPKVYRVFSFARLILFVGGFLSAAVIPTVARAGCVIHTSAGAPVHLPVHLKDPLSRVLEGAPGCPANVLEFRALLKATGATLRTTLVGNRGFHNPSLGSFSLFEMVSAPGVGEGDFFFGHFTTVGASGELTLDQTPRPRALMIELIVRDPAKGWYNFYEMIGDGDRGQWFYRGDSRDILSDAFLLQLQPDPAHPRFGRTLRCAGCHTGGGPIMKELGAPHNDWWSPERPLPFGGHAPDAVLSDALRTLVPADVLAHAVGKGMTDLAASPAFRATQAAQPLPQRLRPLFCTTEVNLASDRNPLEAAVPSVAAPAAFFVDPVLLPPGAANALRIEKLDYLGALGRLGSAFPEIPNARDADHAWLAPVRSMSDTLAVRELIASGLIDAEFASDVLAVDFTQPVLSPPRCALLRAVPPQAVPGWQAQFAGALGAMARNAPPAVADAARELLRNLNDARRNSAFHRARAASFVSACEAKLQSPGGVDPLVALLAQRRKEVFASEISRNPLGQILEPGFRVIFPEVRAPIAPGRWKLDETCAVRDVAGGSTAFTTGR